jgi:uncharacterized membrane protein YjgN (DUF898 family)
MNFLAHPLLDHIWSLTELVGSLDTRADVRRHKMKFRQIEWLAGLFMFLFFVAGRALLKLHATGQPVLGIVLEALLMATLFSLFDYIRKHGDD